MKRCIPLLFMVSFFVQADIFSEDEREMTVGSEQSTAVDVADSSLDIFQEQLPTEGESSLDALDRVPVKRLENTRIKKEQEKKERAEEWTAPSECHCVFNFCLTSVNYSDTWEEREAKKESSRRYYRKLEKKCYQWRRDRKKYGPAVIERELEALSKEHKTELDNALSTIAARKQQEKAERQAYLAQLKAEEATRIAKRKAERIQWRKDAEKYCEAAYQRMGSYCSIQCPLPEKTRDCKTIER